MAAKTYYFAVTNKDYDLTWPVLSQTMHWSWLPWTRQN